MRRSFQTSLILHRPDVAFLLGDLLDEGKWASPEQWEKYMRNALDIFHTPVETSIHFVVGNHDIGFHYAVTEAKLTR